MLCSNEGRNNFMYEWWNLLGSTLFHSDIPVLTAHLYSTQTLVRIFIFHCFSFLPFFFPFVPLSPSPPTLLTTLKDEIKLHLCTSDGTSSMMQTRFQHRAATCVNERKLFLLWTPRTKQEQHNTHI